MKQKLKENLPIIFLAVLLFITIVFTVRIISKQEKVTMKDKWDLDVREYYEELYDTNYASDYAKLEAEELKIMQERLTVGEGLIIEGYWKQAKDFYTPSLKFIVDENPEITNDIVEMPKPQDLMFTAQNTFHDLQSYLKGSYPNSPLIGLNVIDICKKANITAWQCRLGLAIIKHESRYGTAYAGGAAHLGNIDYHNYAGIKCDSKLTKLKPCKFPDENGMWITKFNSPTSFLTYFFEQIIGKNWGACKTTACMSPKYVAPSGERNINWENKINGEILNLHMINY